MVREFHVLGFPSQNNTQRNIKGKGKTILNKWNKPQHSFKNLHFILGSFPADTNWDLMGNGLFHLDLTRFHSCAMTSGKTCMWTRSRDFE